MEVVGEGEGVGTRGVVEGRVWGEGMVGDVRRGCGGDGGHGRLRKRKMCESW